MGCNGGIECVVGCNGGRECVVGGSGNHCDGSTFVVLML